MWSRRNFAQLRTCGKHFSEPRTRYLKRKYHFCITNLEYLQSPIWWETHGCIFPFFMTTSFIKYLCFLRETSFLPFLAGKSSDSTLLAEQGKNRARSQHTRSVALVLGMNLQSFETTGRRVLWTWNWGMISKISPLPCETYRLTACNLSETHTGLFYSSILEQLL